MIFAVRPLGCVQDEALKKFKDLKDVAVTKSIPFPATVLKRFFSVAY